MNKKLKQQVTTGDYLFFCPGCEHLHVFDMSRGWQFNGDMENPTFTPSLLTWVPTPEGGRTNVCHLFLTNGQLIFLDDSHHSLKGQTVPLPEHFLFQ